MIIDKLRKVATFFVVIPDTPDRGVHTVRDAKGNCMMTAFNAIDSLEIAPGDKIMIDVRILVERNVADEGSRLPQGSTSEYI